MLLRIAFCLLCVSSVLLPVALARRSSRDLSTNRVYIPPTCNKVVSEYIRLEKASVHERERLEICGATQGNLFEIFFGKPRTYRQHSHRMMVNKFSDLPNDITNSLTTCDPNASKRYCVCASREACHEKIKFNPSEFYLVRFEIDDSIAMAKKPKENPGPSPVAHYAIVYINKDSTKAFIYHSFAGIHPLVIVETTPYEVLMAFNAIVGRGKLPERGPILEALKKFDVASEWYINTAKHVVVVGGFKKQDCRDAWADKNKLHANICSTMRAEFKFDQNQDKCV